MVGVAIENEAAVNVSADAHLGAVVAIEVVIIILVVVAAVAVAAVVVAEDAVAAVAVAAAEKVRSQRASCTHSTSPRRWPQKTLALQCIEPIIFIFNEIRWQGRSSGDLVRPFTDRTKAGSSVYWYVDVKLDS